MARGNRNPWLIPATFAGYDRRRLNPNHVPKPGTTALIRSTVWRRHRQLWLSSPALLVRGIAQVGQGTASLVADQVTPLDLKSLASAVRTTGR